MSIKDSPYWSKPKVAAKAWMFNLVCLALMAGLASSLLPNSSFISVFIPMIFGFCVTLVVTFIVKQHARTTED